MFILLISGQVAQLEIQQLCEEYAWLADIHLFTSQWSLASLEAMKGQPASLYKEHIERVRQWTERIHTVPPSFTTSNQLFIIHCAHIQEKLGVCERERENGRLGGGLSFYHIMCCKWNYECEGVLCRCFPRATVEVH